MALSAFLLPALWYSTWLAAAISLGHPPRPYVNDPKFINGWVSALLGLTRMAFIVSPLFFVANLSLALMTGIQQYVSERRRWWTILTPLGLTLVTWIAALLLMKLGRREVGIWFWD